MAALVPTDLKVIRTGTNGSVSTMTNAHDAARIGKPYFINMTNGRAYPADAATLAGWGAVADVNGAIVGLVSTKPRFNLASESVTLLTDADVTLGEGVLDTIPFGTPIFVGNTDGTLVTTAAESTTQVQIGYIRPSYRDNGGGADVVDKVLRIDTRHLAILRIIVEE